ncbi:MAG: hypothetical protein N2Z70_04240, partial [Bdellovibrionaceae bacterium]|nr:hypothetical protein [Pseudobdellovibrionaceae bacterium]
MNTSVAVVTKPQEFSPVSKLGPEILSSRWDSWLVGGLSLLFLILFHFFVSPQADIKTISWTMYYASFVVNWPHFMMSYQILYGDLRSHWPEKKRYLWAGLVVPLLLIVAFAFSYLLPSPVGMGLLVQLMFVSVGWHYVKQVYGMMVVPAAKIGFSFDRPLRVAALSNLYSLWALSFVNGNYQERQAEFYGVKYFIPGLPTWLLTVCYVAVGATGLIFLFLLLRRWWERGQWLPAISWVSFLSLYAWYLPITYHPHFFYMVPFFHSLQYILFVAALKRNQGLAE